ncbi:MAG: oligopeptide/dipeptide ABC transporter ATP-binding protein [Thermodesulfobacteriota bacterium]
MSLVKVKNIVKDYNLPRKNLFGKPPVFRALDGINLEIKEGESFGIVGESGCGKSTLARIIMALEQPTSGKVYYNNIDLFSASKLKLRQLRKEFQMVFQDPYSSLNPRKKILSIVGEPLDMLEKSISKKKYKKRVELILEEVGLSYRDIDKYPHEFSGGQRQRIAIARALITKPSLIVADEAVSALDVSVQAQVLNLMMDLQEKYNLAFMFISHDLSVVEFVTQRLAVIYLGKIVETGTTSQIFKKALHPYTQLLFSAIPDVDPDIKTDFKKAETKKIDSLFSPTHSGCVFIDRCPLAADICQTKAPVLQGDIDHQYACHHVDRLLQNTN